MAKKENTIPTIIDTPEALTAKIAAMKEAQKIFATFTQEQVDKIFKAAATAADKARIPLAKDAVEETGMGIVEDKVIKNHYAAEYVYNAYKNTRTCGVIEEDTAYGIKKIAEPIGLIAAVIPTTNPTSTAIFKTLIALKTRNAIIISPHPRAKKCTIEAAKVVLEAAVEVALGLQVKELAHVLAGGVFEGGGLDDGDLAGFAVAGGIAALYAQGIDAVFAGLIHDLTSFPQKR